MSFTRSDIQSWLDRCRLPEARRKAERVFETSVRRNVTPGEIDQLERQGNSAENWNTVQVLEGFSPGAVVGNRFEGSVVLGCFDPQEGSAGIPREAGVFYCTLADCWIGSGARVARCGHLSRYFVAAGALIEGVGRIAMSGESSDFGNSLELFHGELYSRRLRAVAELPFPWAVWATSPEAVSGASAALLEALFAAADAYASSMRSARGYIGPGVKIRASGIIENTWIGQGVEVDGVGSVRDCTLWAEPEAPTVLRDGVQVRDSLIGPGCVLEDLCSIRNSALFGRARVLAQAILKGAAVGLHATLSECEVSDSLLGPFTTAMHHALIINAWWPEGRGNVAYGANVGSNHTGRAPDQEIWPGEGLFFGLGCNIKFPSNFREAPYSIVATGVDALAQKVTFPFSLIVPLSQPLEGVPTGFNEIRPGWALLNNAYGLERRERNLIVRDQASRSGVDPAIFRRDLIDSLDAAIGRLDIPKSSIRPVYIEENIEGLGKNVMTESARKEALESYRLGRRVGAARLLLSHLNALHSSPDGNRNDSAGSGSDIVDWASEILGEEDPEALIEAALDSDRQWADLVRSSKARDSARGAFIIDDYGERHLEGDNDPVIAAVGEDHQRHLASKEASLARLQEKVGS